MGAAGESGGMGAYSFVACFNHLPNDRASLSRRSAVPIPNSLIETPLTFGRSLRFPHILHKTVWVSYLLPASPSVTTRVIFSAPARVDQPGARCDPRTGPRSAPRGLREGLRRPDGGEHFGRMRINLLCMRASFARLAKNTKSSTDRTCCTYLHGRQRAGQP